MTLTEQLSQILPELGHRNWIIIADAAYPKQVSSGIHMIVTGQSHVDTVREVLSQISAQPHVRPEVILDSEILGLENSYSPNSEQLRSEMLSIIQADQLSYLPHEDILELVSDAGRDYSILVFKTNSLTAYSSVFIRLECGYWSSDQETRLRMG